MLSAFGVEHGSIAKFDKPSPTDKVDDELTPLLPGSTVRAYDNSRRNKRKAAFENFAVKGLGGAAGLGLGTLVAAKTKGRFKALNTQTRSFTPQMKHGYYVSSVGSAGAGAGGGLAGNASLESIKNDPQYRYKRRAP